MGPEIRGEPSSGFQKTDRSSGIRPSNSLAHSAVAVRSTESAQASGA